jgi:hypothetical protein
MMSGDWILYEHATHWVAAIRTSLARQLEFCNAPRIFEARRLADVSTRLSRRPANLVLIEVRRGNCRDVLSWLADNVARFPGAHFAALLGSDVQEVQSERRALVETLLEAGICEIADSPRRLHAVLELARRHAESLSDAAEPASALPIREWARAHLPWQADGRRVR